MLPEAWHVENIARLLVLCGNNICYSVLASRAVNRRFLEISRLIVFLILVSARPSLPWGPGSCGEGILSPLSLLRCARRTAFACPGP